uniref:restriction endonuclease n=1 Tax=Photorhabdus sp. RM322S TaxID=3342825 RepID=UPI0036DB00D4
MRELFNSLGYRATTTNYGPDGGKDIVMERDGIKVFAQCKHWKSDNVGVAGEHKNLWGNYVRARSGSLANHVLMKC